jgi:hypothetical protein
MSDIERLSLLSSPGHRTLRTSVRDTKQEFGGAYDDDFDDDDDDDKDEPLELT